MTEEIQLSDAEKRMLRRVFHYHARPYLAALALVALIALFGGSDEAGETEAAADATAPPVDVAALQSAQSRAEELLAEIAAAGEKRAAELDAAHRQIAGLEKRLGSTARRLEKVESVARSALDVAGQAPDGATAAEVSAILERLQALEAREPASAGSVARSSDAGATGGVPASAADTAP